jgi:hypothetical protein
VILKKIFHLQLSLLELQLLLGISIVLLNGSVENLLADQINERVNQTLLFW